MTRFHITEKKIGTETRAISKKEGKESNFFYCKISQCQESDLLHKSEKPESGHIASIGRRVKTGQRQRST